jgi:DNA sulfur modification protein DndD
VIIEQLTLHDFGIYRGRHVIDLSPESDDKPIVMIGARNGRGKTTMLDAINLVLFGQRARLSNRKPNTSWDKYLRDSINRKAPEGALVGMRFSVQDDFETRVYEIARSWTVAGKSVKEFFNVSINGEADQILAEDWDEHIEGILPLEIASLNFFDGEKIDQLADPLQSREVNQAAIRGLLGLGILEKLEADLKVFLRRKQDLAIGDEVSPELAGIENELMSLLHRCDLLHDEQLSVDRLVGDSLKAVEKLESHAKSLGSEKWNQRVEIQNRSRDLAIERAELTAELHALVEGIAPLKLVESLLARASDQVEADVSAVRLQVLLEELTTRDARIIAALPPEVTEVVEQVLIRDRLGVASMAGKQTIHGNSLTLNSSISGAIRDLKLVPPTEAILKRLDEIETLATSVDRQLMAIPTEGELGPILQELGRERSRLESLQLRKSSIDKELEHIASAQNSLNARAARLREEEADKRNEALEERRSREYTQRALETVRQLLDSTVTRNLANIEAAILTRFHQLIGKKNLVTGVSIDPETLELRVSTGDGEHQPIERLSAGERQLLATASLWGLSTVAGRSIPLVIDTPLGRLDGDHRINLSTNYFPYAARQVVILSTDSEFTRELYEKMRHAVGREYTIQFRAENESSEIIPGFFEEDSNAG